MRGFPAYWARDQIVAATIRDHVASHGEPPSSNAQDWPKERILGAVWAWVGEHGETPREDDWKPAPRDAPSVSTVVRIFGSWNAMIEAAGFAGRPRYGRVTRWSKPAVADTMLDWVFRTGGWPTYRQWRTAGGGSRPNAATVVRIFGSWRAAKLYAGWDPDAASRKASPFACAGCGGDEHSETIGCTPCWDRRRQRRAAAKNGAPQGVVEPPFGGGSDAPPDGGCGLAPPDGGLVHGRPVTNTETPAAAAA